MKFLSLLTLLAALSFSTARADDFTPMNQDTITRTNNGTTPVAVGNTSAAVSNISAPSATDTWVFQIDIESSFPTGRLSNQAAEGWGPEGSLGYRFAQNITLSLETGYVGYSAKNGLLNTTWAMVPVLLKGQYNLGNGNIQPYGFLGLGLAVNSQSSFFAAPGDSLNEVDFLQEAGLGISFALLTQTYLFIQTKIEIDDTSAHYAGDQPTVLLPIDIGLNILVN